MTWTQGDPVYRFAPDWAKQSTPRRASLYQFSLNNPLRFLDPNGLDAVGVGQFFDHTDSNSVAGQGAAVEGGGWGAFAAEGGTWDNALRDLIQMGIAKKMRVLQIQVVPPTQIRGGADSRVFAAQWADLCRRDPDKALDILLGVGVVYSVVGVAAAAGAALVAGAVVEATASTSIAGGAGIGLEAAAQPFAGPFAGFQVWGRTVWGAGAGTAAALEKIHSLTPELARTFEPDKVRAALTFYQNAMQSGQGGWTSPLRVISMQSILDMQGK